jgi:hypothetical protein
MKSLLTIITFSITFSVWGQVVSLEPSNPAPRVGDSFSISFVLEKNDPDSLEVANDIMAKLLVSSMNRVGDGHIEISEWFLTDPGPLKIGPFEIPINGKKYKTNVLDMTISPKLPDDVDRGIWIRLINFQGVEYILFEQRQPGEFKPKNEGAWTSYSMSTEDVEWSELHIDKIERMGIEIKKQETRTSIQSIDIGSALYRLIVYTYKPLPSFKDN